MNGWLFLMQQGLSSWSLLLALGLCMGLRRPHLLRLGLTAAGCSGITLCSAGSPWGMGALAVITLLAPVTAWPGVPRNRRPGMSLACLSLSLIMTGCGRLLVHLGLGRTPLVLAQSLLVPLLVRLTPSPGQAACILLEITHQACRLELTALVDSGNLLRDPLTGLPVIVISRQAGQKLMAGQMANLRLIPVRTVTGRALMPVFRPGQVRVRSPGGWRAVQAVVGITPDGCSGCQALVPSSLISPMQGGATLCP